MGTRVRALFLLALCGLFIACARPWSHPAGHGPEVFERDAFDCRVIAREQALVAETVEDETQVGLSVDVVTRTHYRLDKGRFQAAYQACLRERGWRQ